MPASVSRVSLADSVLAALTNSITSGEWPVGMRLPTEGELAARLSVGRNTVREAVKVLVYKGMLEVRQGDGTYVRSSRDSASTMKVIEGAGWRDHLELRSILESEVARYAAIRRTSQDLKELKRSLKARGTQASHKSQDVFYRADAAFHLSVAKASHNVALEELFRFFFVSSGERLKAEFDLATAGEEGEPSLAAHQELVDAIEKGDEEQAVAAAKAIIAPLLKSIVDAP